MLVRGAAVIVCHPLDARIRGVMIMGLRGCPHNADWTSLSISDGQQGNHQHEMTTGAKQAHAHELRDACADLNP